MRETGHDHDREGGGGGGVPLGRKAVTLKDVARAARCSTAVVSTVINHARGNTLVSADMRQRVMAVAAELGYRPDFASRSLVRRSTQTLGIYIAPGPWAGTGFAYESQILKGIEPACRERGYDLLLINLTGDQSPAACAEKFAERRIDGVLLLHAEPGSAWIGELLDAGCNVVAVDYADPQPGLSAVSFDNASAGRVALDHLVSLGHRRVGFLGTCREPVSQDGMARQRAFIQHARDLGLDLHPQWIFDHSRSPRRLRPDEDVCQLEGQMGAEHILELSDSPEPAPTAWVAYSDLVAVHAMQRLQAAGVEIPQDLSVMGVDDSEWCRLVTPHLTSVRHPLAEMGRRAVQILIDHGQRQRDPSGAIQELVPSTLVARASTAPPTR